MNIFEVNFKNISTLKIGGIGKLCEVKNENDLLFAIDFARQNNLKIKVIGRGSNSVFGNNLEKYLFIKILNDTIEIVNEEEDFSFVKIFAGKIFDDVIKFALEKKLYGIENLSHIPGETGSTLIQNIGAYGTEIKDVFYSTNVFDLKDNCFKELFLYDCEFGYRDSIFKKEKLENGGDRYIIYSIILKLSKKFSPNLSYSSLNHLQESFEKNILTAENLRKEIIRIRKEKLPDYKIYPNCGSFFKNIILDTGEKINTAKILEDCGLKNFKKNNFKLSEKHTLILINCEGVGEIDELKNFVQEIQNIVFEKTGLIIEREVNFIE